MLRNLVVVAVLCASACAWAGGASLPKPYQPVELATLIETSRTPVAGQKIIIRPNPVSFSATLLQGPKAQRSDYLRQVLSMMPPEPMPQVQQGIVLGYGNSQGMPAYIDQAIAKRLQTELKIGERRRFYALHVYNYSKGPALVVTGFGERE